MGITLVDLPETDLIVRGKFPTRDETAYEREAANCCAASGCMTQSQAHVVASSGYTTEEFTGRTGDALVQKFSDIHAQFGSDESEFTGAAGWMTLAADNIRTTKTAINAAVTRYHDSYAATCTDADTEAWPQNRLTDAKNALVAQAQGEVDTLWSTYEARHSVIRAGIVAGSAAPDTLPDPAAPSPA